MTRAGGPLELEEENHIRAVPLSREFVPKESCSWQSPEETASRKAWRLGDNPRAADAQEALERLPVWGGHTFWRLEAHLCVTCQSPTLSQVEMLLLPSRGSSFVIPNLYSLSCN